MRNWYLAGALLLAVVGNRAVQAAQLGAFPISVGHGVEFFPKIDGRYVVWTNAAYLGGPAGSTNDVYGYDLLLNQRFPIAVGARNQDEPSNSGNIVLWHDYTSGQPQTLDIYGSDMSSLGSGSFVVTTAPGPQVAHAISGNLAVWADGRNTPQQIWGRRLDQPVGSDFAISRTDVSYEQIFPDVSGNVVVWMSFQEPGDQGNIYGRDLSSGTVFPISTNSAYQFYPQVSGRNVVWNDTRDGAIRVYGKNLDGGSEFPVSSGGADQFEVAIDGDLVVWRDDRSGTSDIWGRFLSHGPEFQITNTPDVSEDYPDVSGNIVVWQQGNSSTSIDIYGIVVPEPISVTMVTGLLSIVMLHPRRHIKRRSMDR